MRKTFGVVLPALILLVSSSLNATGESSAREILDRHLEAIGGRERVKSVQSVVSVAEIEMRSTGARGTARTWSLRPCLSYTEISLGLFRVLQGYDGSRSWTVGPNGRLLYLEDEGSVRRQVTTCFLEDLVYLMGTEEAEYTYAGTDTAAGTSCHVIEMTPEGGIRSSLYIDGTDFLARRVVMFDPEGTVEQTFYDHRSVSGIIFPFRTLTLQKALGQIIDIRTVSIEVNTAVDPSLFLPPSGGTEDFSFTSGDRSEDISFVYRNQHIYLPVELDVIGTRMFLIDSGAGMSVIDQSAAAEIGLELADRIPGAGAGGMTDFYITRTGGFRIDGIEFAEQTVIAYPISDLTGSFSGIRTGGILGYDFLSRFITRIDYERSLISFYAPAGLAPPPGADTLKAPLIHKLFAVRAVLDGRHEGTFLIDTGASSSLLQRKFCEDNSLLEGRKTLGISIVGTGGAEEASIARFESLILGSSVIEEPVFTIPAGTSGIGALEGISGIIGNDILQRFVLYLDYDAQMVYLERNSSFDRPFFADRFGVQLGCGRRGMVVLHLVIPGTPAEAAGLRVGDVITAIDGSPAGGCERMDAIMRVFQQEEGTKVRIDLERAERKISVEVTLEKYI